MAYLIDSHVVIDHLADVPDASDLLSRLAEDGIAISIITYMEAFQGVVRSPHPKEAHAKFRAFAKAVPILPLSVAVAERCARLRETLRSQNKRANSRALDLIIAATEQMATTLKRWTEEVLRDLKRPEEGDWFFFCSLDTAAASPEELYLSPVWETAFGSAKTPLLVME
jgi:predicted nucleic acid-binding protein